MPLAATGAMRLLDTNTPLPSLIFLVWTAASAIVAKMSGDSICVS